jgi:hypothetical protein
MEWWFAGHFGIACPGNRFFILLFFDASRLLLSCASLTRARQKSQPQTDLGWDLSSSHSMILFVASVCANAALPHASFVLFSEFRQLSRRNLSFYPLNISSLFDHRQFF